MGRPRSFEEGAALEAIMAAFWSGGYAATSVRDLARVAEVQPNSLYQAFGDKEALFLVALDRYVAWVAGLVPLDQPPRRQIRLWFEGLLDRAYAADPPRGCLMLTAAAEAEQLPPAVQERVRQGMAQLRAFFAHGVADARGDKADAFAIAEVLVTLIAGLSVRARLGAPEAELREVVARAFVELGLD